MKTSLIRVLLRAHPGAKRPHNYLVAPRNLEPDAKRAYDRAWYVRNRDRIRDRLRSQRKQNVERGLALMRDLKSQPCSDCDIRYPYYVMEFDHRNPAEKRKMRTRGMAVIARRSRGALLKEAEKCDVVCANCHREREHQRHALLVQK